MPAGGIYIDGVEQVQEALGTIVLGAADMQQKALRSGAAVLGEAMQERAPKLSGELEDSLGRSVHIRDLDPGVWVGTTHGLAATFEYGGAITPEQREFLRFMGEEVEGEVFLREAFIPPHPWMRPALDEAASAAQRQAALTARRELLRAAAG